MLDFSEITINDKELIDPYLQIGGQIMSDRCFASLIIWSKKYCLKKCIKNGFLYICSFKNFNNGELCYYMPLGIGSISGAINEIINDSGERGISALIAIITEDRANEFRSFKDAKLTVFEDPADFDYVYLSEKMITLAGKKLHSKRNFINRFSKMYNWEYKDITPNDKDDLLLFLRNICASESTKDRRACEFECDAVKKALDNLNDLNICGGYLTVNGEIAAFTLATKQNDDVMDILIEKADKKYIGAYPMIFNQFAKRHCACCKYINREEDLGLEGLRTSKMSYCPEFLTKKYVAIFDK